MNRINSLISNVIATMMLWLSVVAIRLISGEVEGITTFGIIVAIGTTAAIWIVWAFNVQESEKHMPTEKAKRSTASGDDTRLSLLLELLDEDERQALKERLLTDLQSDGEAVSLADLLAAQERRSKK